MKTRRLIHFNLNTTGSQRSETNKITDNRANNEHTKETTHLQPYNLNTQKRVLEQAQWHMAFAQVDINLPLRCSDDIW